MIAADGEKTECWMFRLDKKNKWKSTKFFPIFTFSLLSLNSWLLGDGGDTNTINLDKYFYFPENNSDFSANNFKIALPNPPPPQQPAQQTWVDFSAVQSATGNNGLPKDAPLELPPLTEIKQEKADDDYATVKDVPVWHTAKSTSKITMYPSKEPRIQSKRKLQQIQPKPPALTVMPPLTQIHSQKPAPKLIAVAVKKIVPIQPKPMTQLPKLTQIQPKHMATSVPSSPPQTKLMIKKVSHIAMNTRRHSTGNSSKIVPTKELLESLKQENIIYQDNEDKPWYCKTCGRNYKWRNSLKQHIKNECGTDEILHAPNQLILIKLLFCSTGVPPKYHCVRKCGYKTHIHSNLKRHLNSKFCKPGGPKNEDD